ncbi:MAG: response regulator transcription factor [Betaproteobacteria bacterium]|nr:response regulator transcription factor [Betaproteobacteria bacterium]
MQDKQEAQRAQLTVYLVDDDPAIRDSLSLSLSLRGFHIAQFASAEDFLNAYDEAWAGCAVVDIRMPGMSGLEMQAVLAERGSHLPIVMITGHGDVASARSAFRHRAVDFLEKPFDDEQLVSAIESAFKLELGRLNKHAGKMRREAMMSSLSPREREVMQYLVRGLHAKEIGEQLGISHRTVEVHKAHIMEKMGVHSVIDIVRIGSGLAEHQ